MPLYPKQEPPYYTEDATGVATKQYIALLTQIGTANPTVTIIKNTIGTITWTRSAAGTYETQVITGEFPTGKTTTQIQGTFPQNVVGISNTQDQLLIYTGNPLGDDILENTPVIINIYP